jgi:hypothetical protein
MIVWGASMPIAPSSANVGMGSWDEAMILSVVSDFDIRRGTGDGKKAYLLRSRSSGTVAAFGAAIVSCF